MVSCVIARQETAAQNSATPPAQSSEYVAAQKMIDPFLQDVIVSKLFKYSQSEGFRSETNRFGA